MLFQASEKEKNKVRGRGKMSDNKDTLLAFVLGGLIGTVLGVLYAPKSGREIRSNIKNFGKEIIDTVDNLGNDFKEDES